MYQPIHMTLYVVRDMHKSQIMSPSKISTVPVEAFLYQSAQIPVDLMTFDQFPELARTIRWDPDRSHGHRDEKPNDKVYVWTLPKGRSNSLGNALPMKPLLNVAKDSLDARPVDVFEIRNEFFEVAEPEQGLSLFKRYGIFGREHMNTFRFTVGLSFAELLQWQKLLKECRLTEPSGWAALSKEHARLRNVGDILWSPDLSIPLESPIRIKLFCGCIRDAIIAAIYLDNLANVKASVCHRQDCGVVFNHESDHQRKYCSPACAHLVAVRNERKRKAEKNSKQAKKAPNRKRRE